MADETREPPAWVGDVHTGVDAWTHGRQRPTGPSPSRSTSPSSRSASASPRFSGPPPDDVAARGPDADPESVARTILLDQLTGRARSRRELADKLAAKLVPDDVATHVLDRFTEVGLIDDEAFARTWVSQRGAAGSGGRARRALSQELRRKGVADEVTAVVLDEVDPADEEQAARALVRKKLRTLSRVDDTTAVRRLVGMLGRKGYPSGMAFGVVREELAAAREVDADETPPFDD